MFIKEILKRIIQAQMGHLPGLAAEGNSHLGRILFDTLTNQWSWRAKKQKGA